MHLKEALDAWREASDDARLAENVLSRMWGDFLTRDGPAPSAEQVAEVREMRNAVAAKFDAVAALVEGRLHR